MKAAEAEADRLEKLAEEMIKKRQKAAERKKQLMDDVQTEKLKLEMAQKAAKAAEAAMLKANQTATKWKKLAAE